MNSIDLLKSLENPELDNPICLSPNFEKDIDKQIDDIALTNDDEAKQLWICKTIVEIQKNFISAFQNIKTEDYYGGWCLFERCEIDLKFLLRHYTIEKEDLHRIDFIKIMVERWQNLYPYKSFFSPELLVKKVSCGICGERITPRLNCGHLIGEIYAGKCCFELVEELEFLGFAIVEKPVQKYSVLFSTDPTTRERIDNYDYSIVKFVADRVNSAFHEWDSYATTRDISASELVNLPLENQCPCVSGKNYGSCCAGKSNLTIPHLQICLSQPPKGVFPENELFIL